MLLAFVVGRECWLNFLLRTQSIETHRRLRRVYDKDVINISSFRRFVLHFKGGEKGTDDRPCSGRPAKAATTWSKERLCWFGMTPHHGVNCNPQEGLENKRVWLSSENLPKKILTFKNTTARRKFCVEISLHWEGRRCFSVKNNYRWWKSLSSLRPINEKTISGMAWTVVAIKKKIQDADCCG